MPTLTFAQLESICATVKAGNPHYSPLSAQWCTDLYFTGCRPNELTNRQRWSYDGASTYALQPLKSNNLRYFDASILTGGLKRFIAGDQNQYSLISYSRMKQIFTTTSPFTQVYHETKAMDLYLFRYRYVKYLRLIGYSDLQIQDDMGWVDSFHVNGYADAILTY